MSYEAQETSDTGGKPVELHIFARGSTLTRYTSADRDQEVAGNVYTAANITRGAIEQGSEMNRSALKLKVPRNFPIADLYRVTPPTDTVVYSLQRFHAGDGELATLWTGRVVNVAWSADFGQAVITLEPVFTSLRRNGLRRVYGAQCPHVLYGPACGVNKAAHQLDVVVDAVSGSTLTASEFGAAPVGDFDGGFLEYDQAGGVVDRRFIYAQPGATVTLASPAYGLPVGAGARAFPGCDHSLATCAGKFSNSDNYGGTPFIPQKNPFSGDPIY